MRWRFERGEKPAKLEKLVGPVEAAANASLFASTS
jgi:hypothetical protein